MNTDELRKKVAKITWWHRIDLGHGVVTPGVDATADRSKSLGFSADLPD